jgi:hypothetical protein
VSVFVYIFCILKDRRCFDTLVTPVSTSVSWSRRVLSRYNNTGIAWMHAHQRLPEKVKLDSTLQLQSHPAFPRIRSIGKPCHRIPDRLGGPLEWSSAPKPHSVRIPTREPTERRTKPHVLHTRPRRPWSRPTARPSVT